ncbi:phosphotransferase system, mannose-type, protein IIA [Syntrophotalea carbinolica DSM 2380]|uniref:Phosphotransferase system, mannose-type, protein IIA n=1 Tax=Syntrophotalea carbinolica (strain DSM 2380 / NBRC 103641 / GraBd1) TaxID=338963 RepID=Q3A382_SYNC1|nr:phosphotransferase system, mannose-type, protein IIA [Syntrophotalea carbinolica]ABA89175.1 phosphotransferase system, mannose-type, protein IIA [Syntrophotalea carbinolica DSM 2380]
MVGLVVATHCSLAGELVKTAEMILGPLPMVASVEIRHGQGADEIRQGFSHAIDKVGIDGDGVLILTDMFGGTPSNIGFSFLEQGLVDVLSGVNLPMLLRASQERSGRTMSDLAVLLRDYGQQSILLASDILSK